MEFDLHIHSKHSFDCQMEPEKIVQVARKKNLNGIAIADHNAIEGTLEAIKFASADFLVIPACEISTEAGDILAYFVTEKPPDTKNPFEIVQWIKSKNGIAVMAHPFAYRLSIDAKLIKLLDGIEGFNARHTSVKILDQPYNPNSGGDYEIAAFAQANNLAMTGGSDAHTYGEIGNGRTIIPASNLEEVRYAILNKNTAVAGKKTSLLTKITSIAINIIAKKM